MRARVLIRPKAGILDPQGQAVERALPALGFEGVANVHVADPAEAERGQRALDRLALGIEDPGLGPDQHAGPHGAVRSSQAENGSPASVS